MKFRTLTAWTLRLLYVPLATGVVLAQTLAVSPTALTFSYQFNDTTLPAAKPLAVTAKGYTTAPTVVVSTTSTGWLTAIVSNTGSDRGKPPFSVSVSVNPTGLTPGTSYSGTVELDTLPSSGTPLVVAVTLSVRNPPSTLKVSSTSSNYTLATNTLAFDYVTGGSVSPASSEIDVTSTGDTIPFVVASAAAAGGGSTVWAQVATGSQLPGTKTSGVALSGSAVPITVTLDDVTVPTLSPGSYANTITVTANASKTPAAVITVTLVVAAGAPTVGSIFPSSVIANPVVDPTITIYGDNFFNTSVVSLVQLTPTAGQPITLTSTLLSRKVLRAVIPAGYLTAISTWNVCVTNPAPPSAPSQPPATKGFAVTSPSDPTISSIVSSASYLVSSVFAGLGGTDPVTPAVSPTGTSVAPRELITIFGQNLGPADFTMLDPTGTPLAYPTTDSTGVTVSFTIPGIVTPVLAPLIMVSANQINAIVPAEVSTVVGSANTIAVTVFNGTNSTAYQVTAILGDPGVFTFDGLGKGQGAILNVDSTGASTINSSAAAAAKSSTVKIYATGLGGVTAATPPANGEVATASVPVTANTVRVDIDGQPSVVTYAGTPTGSVVGLVEVTAIVPPTARTGGSIPVTVSVGPAATARRSQAQVTMAVK